MEVEADICIICEGSYPYFAGGVAQWVHELIEEHSEKTFHILTLTPPYTNVSMHYQLPKNVIGHTKYIVQDLPEGAPPSKTPPETWKVIGPALKELINFPDFDKFLPVMQFFRKYEAILGKRILIESMGAWDFTIKLYNEEIPSGPFKSYFGTAYTMTRSLYSMLLPKLPKAKIYHSVCTGFAGLILARAKLEQGSPCILTEHGIYTNERRIEIAMSAWIKEAGSLDLALEEKKKTLKDFWLNAFYSMAHTCYINCDEVLCTFDGNKELQLEGGADPAKVRTIVHGIDQSNYSLINRDFIWEPNPPRPKTVAFIGRIVPIKDVKTFIRACKIVHERLPDLRLWALGPTNEDPEYYEECLALTESMGLKEHLLFLGKVKLKEYFSQVDLLVLTSASEAQPLVMLEAGATGIPSVATHVGACKQIIFGSEEESPPLGAAGIVTPLVNPEATAEAIIQLMTEEAFYKKCAKTMAKRIETYYVFEKEHDEYRKIYRKYLTKKES